MPIAKPTLPDHSSRDKDVNLDFGTEEGIESSRDYELDELLRKLSSRQWFATADEGFPFWSF